MCVVKNRLTYHHLDVKNLCAGWSHGAAQPHGILEMPAPARLTVAVEDIQPVRQHHAKMTSSFSMDKKRASSVERLLLGHIPG